MFTIACGYLEPFRFIS